MNGLLKRRLAAVVLAVLAVVGVNLVLTTTPASAATCTTILEAPHRSANRVQALGEIGTGCAGSWKLQLSRWKGTGWEVLDEATLCAGCASLVSWVCTGSGTNTYRSTLRRDVTVVTFREARLTC
ncbi:hypothetical protein Rhe02_58980 [Rhizocola hellebori]|uniref:Secreted protein n=1 Tax=Rhizocola hellebori TaxID=1392758 RepID=A0A8J3QC24_9ACTN|nr:hypothetical protein [Rhizocola hellebori]GIH07831.1 hypothetical protein Rhe02_58980 [Rhizocola hellebori]